MAQLAIRGHATRGKEVIELLEMLGGINKHQITAIKETYVYFVDEDGIIRLLKIQQLLPEQFIVFTLEDFLEKFPYKVGNKVTTIYAIYGKISIIEKLVWSDKYNAVRYELDDDEENLYFANELQPYKEETMEEKLEQIILEIPTGYEFFGINDDNKVVLTKKQLKHPQTYEECCETLNVINTEIPYIILSQLGKPINSLAKLIVCRDAYWKIAGEEMGLEKPWEPVWTESNPKYTIAVVENGLVKTFALTQNYILAFPTEEMRDAFYENFKDLIEQCKELL